MNVNEVIANRCIDIMGGERGSKGMVSIIAISYLFIISAQLSPADVTDT